MALLCSMMTGTLAMEVCRAAAPWWWGWILQGPGRDQCEQGLQGGQSGSKTCQGGHGGALCGPGSNCSAHREALPAQQLQAFLACAVPLAG